MHKCIVQEVYKLLTSFPLFRASYCLALHFQREEGEKKKKKTPFPEKRTHIGVTLSSSCINNSFRWEREISKLCMLWSTITSTSQAGEQIVQGLSQWHRDWATATSPPGAILLPVLQARDSTGWVSSGYVGHPIRKGVQKCYYTL